MASGIKFNDIKTYENLVIDGHHRYLSSLISGYNIGEIASNKTSGTREYSWADIVFVEEDWDTNSKIIHLNEVDAFYNNIDVEILHQITASPKK